MRALSQILIEADNTDSIFKLIELLKELKQTSSEREPICTKFGVEHITERAEQIGIQGSVSYEQFKNELR